MLLSIKKQKREKEAEWGQTEELQHILEHTQNSYTLALRDIEIIECLIACKLQSHSSIYVNFHKFTHAHVTYSYFVTACNTQPPEKFCIYVTVSVLCMP